MPASQAVALEGASEHAVAARRRSWLRRHRAVLLLAAVAFVASLLVHQRLLPHYSGDHDEPVYRFQAEMLLDGKLTLSAAEQQHFFRPWLSGQVGDRIVMAFSPGWPAVLALSRLLTGSMLTAVALSAAGAAVACYLFAEELLGDRRVALVAAWVLALSPMFLLLGGTYLNYTFALGLELSTGWMLLRGLRTGRRSWLVGAGVAAGCTLLTRPYDALLVAVLLGAHALWTGRRALPAAFRRLAWVAAGGLPFVAATLVYNAAVCGAPLEFPTTAQSGGHANFFFGYRSIAADMPGYDYSPARALDSLWKNVHTTPTWILGGIVTFGLAAFGLLTVWRKRRDAAALLAGMTVLFPLAYLLWWASLLTVSGALHGLGPHYYFPMFPPLAILAGAAAVELWSRRRALLVAGAAVGLVLTVVSAIPTVDDKLDQARTKGDHAEQVERALDAAGSGDKIAILERQPYPYVMSKWAYLANSPDLHGDVLYAADRGADSVDLVDRFPHRQVVRLVRQFSPGDDISRPALVAKPVTSVRGRELGLQVRAPKPAEPPRYVVAYVRQAGRSARLLLDPATPGRDYRVTWRISADGTVTTPDDDDDVAFRLLDGGGRVSFGLTFSDSPVLFWATRTERRYDYRFPGVGDHRTVEVLLADEEWYRFPTGWLPLDLSKSFRADWEVTAP